MKAEGREAREKQEEEGWLNFTCLEPMAKFFSSSHSLPFLPPYLSRDRGGEKGKGKLFPPLCVGTHACQGIVGRKRMYGSRNHSALSSSSAGEGKRRKKGSPTEHPHSICIIYSPAFGGKLTVPLLKKISPLRTARLRSRRGRGERCSCACPCSRGGPPRGSSRSRTRT